MKEERRRRPRSDGRQGPFAPVTEHPKEPTMRRLFVSSALMLLALTPTIAQSIQKPHSAKPPIGNHGFAAPETKAQAPGTPGAKEQAPRAPARKEQAAAVPAPHQANLPDQVFVIRATRGGAAEIELARL